MNDKTSGKTDTAVELIEDELDTVTGGVSRTPDSFKSVKGKDEKRWSIEKAAFDGKGNDLVTETVKQRFATEEIKREG